MTLGTASYFPAEFGLDAGRSTPHDQRRSSTRRAPIVDAEILQPTHPIFYGYDKKQIPVRYGNGPLLRAACREARTSRRRRAC